MNTFRVAQERKEKRKPRKNKIILALANMAPNSEAIKV